jgi:hypothetical protein
LDLTSQAQVRLDVAAACHGWGLTGDEVEDRVTAVTTIRIAVRESRFA